MDFIKKRLFLVLSLTLVLAGIALFIPGFMAHAQNEKEMNQIKREYESIRTLARKTIHDNVMAQVQANKELAQRDVAQVVDLARQTSSRPLIFDKVFPELEDKNSKIIYYRRFAERYCQFVEQLLEQINAGDRPSVREEEQIRLEQQDATLLTRRGQTTRFGSTETQADKLINANRRRQAQSIAVYANTDVFFGFDHWKTDPTGDEITMLNDSWFTQIAAWIQTDVAQTVRQINGQSHSAFDSVVKRLIEISFGGSPLTSTPTVVRPGKSSQRNEPAGVALIREDIQRKKMPAYVIAQRDGEGKILSAVGEMATAYTDRASSGLIDVVHFELAVIIDARNVNDFINTLQSEKYTEVTLPDGTIQKLNARNQITVLQMALEPVDIEAEHKAGYYYGPGNLKVLRLLCEYIFFKSGYEKFKPAPVKALFDVTTETSRSSRRQSR